MTGVRMVCASFQRAPNTTQRDWSNSGATGATCTGQFSGETFSSQVLGSKMLRGSGENALSV